MDLHAMEGKAAGRARKQLLIVCAIFTFHVSPVNSGQLRKRLPL